MTQNRDKFIFRVTGVKNNDTETKEPFKLEMVYHN